MMDWWVVLNCCDSNTLPVLEIFLNPSLDVAEYTLLKLAFYLINALVLFHMHPDRVLILTSFYYSV